MSSLGRVMAKERFIVVVGRVVFGATALMADEARMRNQQSVHMARMWCGARYYCLFAMVVGMERIDATEAIPPS